jgi:CDP-glucose 4,6-dehydratase
VEVKAAFWRGRTVLVTGVTGFKGSWLAMLLAHLGAKVSGYALAPPTRPSLFERAGLGRDVDWIEGDVRDLDRLQAVMRAQAPQVVFHLAAQPLVRVSYEAPVETFDVNVMGTVNLLEAVRGSSETRAVVVVTSDKCYEDAPRPGGYREDDRLGGHDPYAASKACAELVAQAYRRSFFGAGGPVVVTARAGNVIGGGDWAKDRLVPDIVTALAASRAAVIRNPQCVRPWQHVLDPLGGYLLLAEAAITASTDLEPSWNFGPSSTAMQPVATVAGQICRLWGKDAHWRHDGGVHPHEALKLTLDSARARDRLGWSPALPYEQAVEWTTEWYRIVLGGGDARLRTTRHLQQYLERAA